VILPEEGLLFLVEAADVLFHAYDLGVELMHGLLEFLVAVLLIGKVIFHVLVHAINILFTVKKLVLFR
jgi:hypothetical protein